NAFDVSYQDQQDIDLADGGHGLLCFYSRIAQGGDGIDGRAVLHGNEAGVVQLRQGAIDVGVIDLSGAGLVASGNVCDVDQADPVDVVFELLDQVSARALLVVEVVQHLDVG